VRGSCYDVLGVTSNADEKQIRARYLSLMRRYHPDVNRSPLAHARAARIGEAFRTLSDSASRAHHDAELAKQRQQAVSTRAVSLYRSRKARRAGGLVDGLDRFKGPAALAALLIATAVAGWHMENHLTGDRPATSSGIQGGDHSEVRQACRRSQQRR
jgi:curved DNA-binding protein CbpA